MPGYLIYILKVNVCLIGFYAFYWFFLRRSTFFVFNRVYLLAGLAVSFVIPLLRIPVPEVAPLFDWNVETVEIFSRGTVIIEPLLPSDIIPATPFPIWKILSGIYLTGSSLLLIRFLSSFFRIIQLKRTAKPLRSGRWHVRRTDGIMAFSFFRTIFLPRSESGRLVLEHERVHVRQGHTVDLLFMETAVLLLWFNPCVFLYRRSLKFQHEYLADDRIVRLEGGAENYLECILEQIGAGHPEPLAHAFGSQSLKKRIHMMTKNKTPRRYAWTYLLALPLLAALTFGFSARAEVIPAIEQASVVTTPPVDPLDYTPSILPIKKGLAVREGDNFIIISLMRNGRSGIDIAVPQGTEVLAAASGQVTESRYSDSRGNYIVIKHNDEYSTVYAHLEKATVKSGDAVSKGQSIGTVGSTGLSTGPHLHYEVHKNGEFVDPMDYIQK